MLAPYGSIQTIPIKSSADYYSTELDDIEFRCYSKTAITHSHAVHYYPWLFIVHCVIFKYSLYEFSIEKWSMNASESLNCDCDEGEW